ncbi:hypothetical protein [Sulfurimonas sp.]|uniref:hypothetical protein n=1 Tax=Sulfurimonas sp. TaxID=2022749 RepID=UPI002633884C|nr:hypothetical protein [Sulfurimonas sp.]
MIRLLLLFILPFSLYAAKILSYNIYDRTDRVDVMITFDTPYNGTIRQSKTKSKIIIKLEDTSIESPKTKKVGSKFLQTLSIIPLKSQTQLIATIPTSNIMLLASKTVDGYGLRLRFMQKAINTKKSPQSNEASINTADSLMNLPTKKDNPVSQSYYIVISIMIIGVFLLFYLKRKVQSKGQTQTSKKDTWLFKANQTNTVKEKNQKNDENISIRFQKTIDTENSVVMLDFANQSYLVLLGKSNILLDKFTDNKPTSQQEFDSILQNRHEELEAFLSNSNEDRNIKQQEKQEPLQAYKEKAASLLYSDN